MANSQTTPDVLSQPFAENGDKNVIPAANDPTTGLASLSLGLPPITSQRIQDGGKAPRRADVNGIMNLVSQQHYFFQNGGFYPFRDDVSSAIGGYPVNALLLNVGNNGELSFMQSLVGNNTYNYITNPEYIDNVHWRQIKLSGFSLPVFYNGWFDYQINSIDWLRADTFSWQSGTVYSNAYNHLTDDMSGKTQADVLSEIVGSYTVYYYLADDGHKICLPDQETTVANIYNESGVAWYYILDTTNQRFKLPRENPAREVLGQSAAVIGNGKSLGLTDSAQLGIHKISGNSSSLLSVQNGSGGTAGSINANGVDTTLATERLMGVTTDSTKSGMIAKLSETTGVYKGKKYLYFYVGQFSQTATEQTAGLNSELFNGKMDLDLGNATQVTKDTIVGWGMPDYSSAVSFSSSIAAPYDCMIECGVTAAYNSGWVEINGARRQLGSGRDDSHCVWYTAYVPKGTTIASSGCNVSRYYKLKGV